jgi:hypothetical protein
LVSERRRAPLNSFSVDPNNANVLIAEQVIPETAGGWWIREMGLFDEDGDLIFVCNTPPTYKPQLAEGSGRTQVVRMAAIVSDTASVTLKVDPSVVLATREYVDVKAVELQTEFDSRLKSRRRYVDTVDDLKLIQNIEVGQTVDTLGYYEKDDGGGSEYIISEDSSVDNFSSFSLVNGLYAHPKNESKVKSTEFGIMPDGSTNWELDHGPRVSAMLKKLGEGVEVIFPKTKQGNLYKTGLNIFNTVGDNITMSFEESVEFGGILHIISSGSPIFDKSVSVETGTNPTITFSEPHTITSPRYCVFRDTGTSLDNGSYLVTPTGATTVTVEAEVTGSDLGSGLCSDKPIQNVRLKGTYTTYDRFGVINVDGMTADRVICKSNPAKHVSGLNGRGVHVYSRCKNFDIRELIVEETADQNESANMHAAIAFDGVGLENMNIGKIWVKDCRVNGVIIQGRSYNIGQIIVEAYGRGVMSSTIPFVGVEDYFGQLSSETAHGVWFARASGHVGLISVNQNKGFSSRAYANVDVLFDRDYLEYDIYPDSFEDLRMAMSVDVIELFNVKSTGVSFGKYKGGWSTAQVGKISVSNLDDANAMLNSESTRLERGVVEIAWASARIGEIKAGNIKQASVLKHNAFNLPANDPSMPRMPFVQVDLIDVFDHASEAVSVACNYNFGTIKFDNVSIIDNQYLNPSIISKNTVRSGGIKSIVGKLPSPVNKCLLKLLGGRSINVSSIESFNFNANDATNHAAIFLEGCTYSNISCVNISNDSATTGAGIEMTDTYNTKLENVVVENTAVGVKGSANSRMMAIGCVSINNTTNTVLAASQLAVDLNNYSWTTA